MAAWGIENAGKDCYKVIWFPYRWQCREWIAKKSAKRRFAQNNALDNHLKAKVRFVKYRTVKDTRRKKG